MAINLTDYAKQLTVSEQEPKQTALFYGESFSGKTWAVAQLAKKYKLKWMDLEQGAATLPAAIPEEFHGNVELLQIKDSAEDPFAAKTVLRILQGKGVVRLSDNGKVWSPKKPGQQPGPEDNVTEWNPASWGTDTVLVLDTLTALSDSAMNHYLGAAPEMNYKKKEYSHYDNQGLYLKNMLVAAQRLPCHVVFITHQEEIEQEDGSSKLTPLGGTRNFAKTIARKFDHVVHCKVFNRKHSLNSVTTKDHKVIAGSRLNVTLESVDDVATMFKLASKDSNTQSTKSQNTSALAAKLANKS